MIARGGIMLLVLATLLSCSCSTRLVRLLFDEPPASQEVAAAADSLPPPVEATGLTQQVPLTEVVHSPYEENDCESCHSIGYGSRARGRGSIPGSDASGDRSGSSLVMPASKLCYECHDDMTVESFEAEDKTIHYPVEEGECLQCHDPHKSKFASLLRQAMPVERLCFSCHESEDILTSDQHGDMTPEERNCIECHDPHASAEEYLLK
jgi:predicted CXXCH cytochrome family protein